MIIEDKILINSKPDKVFQFFESMDENYLQWHKDHICYRYVKGKGLKEGVVVYFEEKIGDEMLKKTVAYNKIIPNKYIEFVPSNWFTRLFVPKMTFIFNEIENQTEFIGQIHMRGIGPIGKYLNRKNIMGIRKHIKEEGINLKRIIENNI